MNFAGKAYLKKRNQNLPVIKERDLEESFVPASSQLSQANLEAFNAAEEKKEEAAPRRRIRRQRSVESITKLSLDRSLSSESNSEHDEDAEGNYSSGENSLVGMEEVKAGEDHFHLKVDTNVVSIALGTLQQAGIFATGEPVICPSCQAALNCYSRIINNPDNTQSWKCEFCEAENAINIDIEEIPQGDTLDYMIMSANQMAEASQSASDENKEIHVVFCIDISGSMCVSEAVTGKIQLKTHKKIDLGISDFDMNEQFMEGERQITYVSRLECVQAAIEAQLQQMAVATPDRKVGIVTFNNEVSIIGDGTAEALTLTGDKLWNFDTCLQTGIASESRMRQTIQTTKDSMVEKLINLYEGGPTALGPALVAAIGIATNGRPGSKVVVCTDGLANVGLGKLDETQDWEQAEMFYNKVGNLAKDRGIEISVISITGEDCKLSQLGKVCEITGGDIVRVSPLNIANEFASILQTPVIATQVSALIKLHRGLMFRYQNEGLVDPSTLKKELGNVTAEAEFTFEYSTRPSEELEALGIDPGSNEKIPFQTQIHFTKPDGMRCMRVLTSLQDVTDDLDEAATNVDLKVLGVNAAQRSAQLASQGEYREAQAVMRSWKRMMKRNAGEEQQHYVNYYLDNLSGLNRNLNEVIEGEKVSNQDMGREELQQARNYSRNDHLSHMAFRAKNASSNQKKECTIM